MPTTKKAAEALAELCRTYWRPVFSYVCRRGYSAEDAQDITQDFFLMILKTNWLRQADQSRGRFRLLLLKSVQNFLHNVTDTKQTLKRGGAVQFVSWDACMAEAPSQILDLATRACLACTRATFRSSLGRDSRRAGAPAFA